MLNADKGYDKVIIIGNGFDLNLGLKTSYKDFIQGAEFGNLIRMRNHLALYLKSRFDLEDWVDIEKELKRYTPEILANFKREFQDLSYALKTYLSNINKSFISSSEAYRLIEENVKLNLAVVDFNYTDTAESILLENGIQYGQLHNVYTRIHGSLKHNIIFGVEDNIDMEGKVFLKKSCNMNYKPINIDNLLMNAQEVIFFGHSLGETDHMYFSSFFQTFHRNAAKGQKLTLYYHGQEGYDKMMIQLDKITIHGVKALKENPNYFEVDSYISTPASQLSSQQLVMS